ncbi:MAG: hypothetical protein MJ093_05610 [Saccharofermentans sp.]|nr:hypothetical protein [Saccharofermentans sp.]
MNKIKNDYLSAILEDKSLSDDKSGINILLKHDYYSSDSIHGRELLANFLDCVSNAQISINSIIIIDSGVKLFEQFEIKDLLNSCIQKCSSVYVCAESLDEYTASINEFKNLVITDALIIFEQILSNKIDIIIE